MSLPSSLLRGAKDTQMSFRWKAMQSWETIPNTEQSEKNIPRLKIAH